MIAPPEILPKRLLEIAADRKAAGESCHAHASSQSVRQVGSGRLAGHVRIGRKHDLLYAVSLDAPEQLVDPQVLRLDAVERRERAPEDVVQAAELARPLDRDEVDRLLDHADHRVIAASVAADRTDFLLGQVPALVAEAHTLLDVLDRRGERKRLVLRSLQEVEGEPVGRSRTHAGQARELGDEVFHSGAEHLPYCADMPRIAEVALFTEDVSGLAAFYERLLGRPPDSKSESHASFELHGTTLFIHVAGPDGAEGSPNEDHVAFALDQDKAAERAREGGVQVVGPRDFYWGRAAYLRDPDGRAVELQADS